MFSCSYTIGKQKNGNSINVEVGHLPLLFPLQNHINVNIQIIAPGVETMSECPKDTQDLMRGHQAKY